MCWSSPIMMVKAPDSFALFCSSGFTLSSGKINFIAVGASFSGLKSFLAISEENRKGDQLPGIPCKDSTDNELIVWMQVVNEAYAGAKMDLLLKGDNVAKYPAFKNVLTAFKRNNIQKFQMVTNPENAPAGSELYNKSMSGEKQEN